MESRRVVLEAGPSVVVDGIRRAVGWELVDGSGLVTGDEARATVSADGEIIALLPACTTTEALAILRQAGVVDVDVDVVDTGAWPLAVCGAAFEGGGPGVFTHDHEYLDEDAVRRWIGQSLAPGIAVRPHRDGDEPAFVIVADGVGMTPRRAVGQELVASLNAALERLRADHRWYTLPSLDERAVHLRLDRDTATRLGVGVFPRVGG
jgi:hypothetical protein